MRIEEIGGEFSLIRQLAALIPHDHKNLVAGIGDDTAVIRQDHDTRRYLLVTADTLVEGNHFKTNWSTPEQIGEKAVECNVSDIAAMGGSPTLLFISLVVPKDIHVEWINGLYKGISAACKRYAVVIGGGDTTRGQNIIIGMSLLGYVRTTALCLRSHGRPGDLLVVSGTLGAAAAGYELLMKNTPVPPYLLKKHLTPRCRMDIVPMVSRLANAMIDISDGLAAEVNHICSQSRTGAIVFEDHLPLHPELFSAAGILGLSPEGIALTGGEDLELLFSIPEKNMDELRQSGIEHHVVGKLTETKEGVLLEQKNGRRTPLLGGYNHFTPVAG
ncbi:MAG: thiamine-phosphate kinase [Desulfobacteraceae bacterium]|nr:thiamine-phosphate kinase [Desulfobacteraceae bacterium]